MFVKNTKPWPQLNIAGLRQRAPAAPQPAYSWSSSNAAFAGRGSNQLLLKR
jgi:hypothetical protein